MTSIFDVAGDDEYRDRYARKFGTAAKADINEVGEFATSVSNVLTGDDRIEDYWDEQLPQAGKVVMRETFAKSGQALLTAGSIAPIAYDYMFDNGTEAQDWYFENAVDDLGGDAVDHWTPNGGEIDAPVELVANVIGGVGNFVATGPAGFVATQQMTAGLDAAREGQEDAALMGAVRGVASAVGAWLPVFGNTLGSKMLVAGLSNPAIGIVERAAQGEIAEGDYKQNFNPWDTSSIMMDALMGMAFAGRSAIKGEVAPTVADAVFGKRLVELGGSIKDRATFLKAQGEAPGLHDALMVMANYNHRVYGTMPGRPVSPDVVYNHVNQLDSAVESLNRGEPVNVKASRLEFEDAKPSSMSADDVKAFTDSFVDDASLPSKPEKPSSKAVIRDAVDVETASIQSLIDEYGDFETMTESVNPTTGQVEMVSGGKASDVIGEIRAERSAAETLKAAVKEAAACILGV